MNCNRKNCDCPAKFTVLGFNLCQSCMYELQENIDSIEEIEQKRLIEIIGAFRHTIPGFFSKKLLSAEEVRAEFKKMCTKL